MANDSQSRTARRKKMKQSKQGKRKPRLKKLILSFLIIGLVLLIGTGSLFAYYVSTAPQLDESQLSDPLSSKVLDRNNKVVADLAGAERRTKVSYNDLPPVLIDSVIATEDSRFFNHIGIDYQRIIAAVWANITDGFGAEGASTITQQVVKKSFLTDKKTIERKVQEQYLAIKLDQDYSKEKILEMYLNKIYYGAGAYGVAEAAETYFGKTDLSNLTLPEAALLAGLPQRPSGYMPFDNPDLAKDRMNTVLNLMVQHGKITQEEANKAKKTTIDDLLIERESQENTPYDAFLSQVRKEIKKKLDGVDILKDGLRIYTTLDINAQKQVQELLSDNGPISWPDDKIETGITVTDTQTGAVRAIGGGRSYKEGQFNFATDIKRQPGSTFKPITAYGPAIQYEKWSTYHQIKDEPTRFGTEANPYQPGNYDNQFRGWISARYALSRSINIPAIKTLDEIGIDRAKEFSEGLGIEFHKDTMRLSDAIGGSSTGVSPLQMSGSYAAFGNEGVYHEPYTVRKIEIPGEETINTKPKPNSAMNNYTAYMISSMLQTTMSEGTGRAANVPGVPEAGKTGTTNRTLPDGSTVTPDSWFNGYTTNYSISIWTGYEDPDTDMSASSRNIPKQIFKPLMTQLSDGKETADFTNPDSVEWIEVEEGSRPAKLPSKYTPSSRIVTELFHVDNSPSRVSQKYEKLDPVQSLSATFNNDSDAIELSWSYEESEGVSFEVSVAINNGEPRVLTTTTDTSLNLTNVEPGALYQFSVVAVSNDEQAESSDPVTTEVQTEGTDANEEGDPQENEDEQGNSDENNENGNGNTGNENNEDENGNSNSGNQNNENENGNNNSGNQNNENENGNNNSGNENGDNGDSTGSDSTDETNSDDSSSGSDSGTGNDNSGSGESEDTSENNQPA